MSPTAVDLPSDPHARRALLDAYFPRRLAEASRRADGRWDIIVRPFDDAEMHVDPRLEEGLAWWDPAIDIDDVPLAVRHAGNSQLSLEDAWTATALSRWWTGRPDQPLTVLHVDDHTDLMEPLLSRSGSGAWLDLLTGDAVDLRRPDTVAGAVASGAIGVAGFFTPFVHAVARGEIRHLRPPRHGTPRAGRLALVPTDVADTLLAPGSVRPAVELTAEPNQPTSWTYDVTVDVDEWLADLPPGPVLLHVDFDYFCNRFDGDSDWQRHRRSNDVSHSEVARRVDTLVDAIERAGVADAIDGVCGALSPGFFPAELWRSTVERLGAGLARQGIDVRAWH